MTLRSYPIFLFKKLRRVVQPLERKQPDAKRIEGRLPRERPDLLHETGPAEPLCDYRLRAVIMGRSAPDTIAIQAIVG